MTVLVGGTFPPLLALANILAFGFFNKDVRKDHSEAANCSVEPIKARLGECGQHWAVNL